MYESTFLKSLKELGLDKANDVAIIGSFVKSIKGEYEQACCKKAYLLSALKLLVGLIKSLNLLSKLQSSNN